MKTTLPVFRVFATAALLLTMAPQAFAGSMKWFERETKNNTMCKPSPVNRLVRPPVCLGFEMGMSLMADNQTSSSLLANPSLES